MPKAELIRFVMAQRHPPYGHRTGLFQAAYELCNGADTETAARSEIRAILNWFEKHLKTPARLSVSRHPRADETAISWLRLEAKEHVEQMRRLATLLEFAGAAVDALRTNRPGYVVYEDEHQIVALPFMETPN